MHDTQGIFAQTAERLKKSAQEGHSFDAAQVKVIGLNAIRDAAGDAWPGMADRIRANSLNFLQGCLDKDDIVIPAGDGFLVIYASTNGRDLDRESDTLRDSLNAFYLGAEGMERLRAQVTRRSIDAQTMTGIIAASPSPQARRHAISFAPIWTPKAEVVGAYAATPVFRDGDGFRFGYDAEYRQTGRHADTDYTELDIEVLGRAVAGAAYAAQTGQRCVIGYCVHASTLQRRASWRAFEEKLSQTPDALRPSLFVKIAEIEPGTPIITMSDWVSRLLPVTPRVTLGLHHTDRALDGLAATRARTVSVSLSAQNVLGADRQSACKSVVERWNLALHRQHLAFCADGIDNSGLLAFVCALGVDHVTGVKFWPLTHSPAGIVASTRASLLQRELNPDTQMNRPGFAGGSNS